MMKQERQVSLTNNSTKIAGSYGSESEISSSAPNTAPNSDERDERTSRDGASIALPAHVAGSGSLDRLIDTARGYAEASTAGNTNKAYAADWKHFSRWCRLKGTEPLPPAPEMIGLYVADLAAPTGKAPALSVSTIERRLSGLAWNYRQRGFTLDRKDRHIATVLAGIKRKHARPPVQKEAILPEDIQAMVATLPFDLRGLRDRAILLLGYAGGLRRSEVVSLDIHKDDTPDTGGWLEIFDKGALLTLNAKTGWREVEVGRGSSDQTCPVHALEQWLHFGSIDFGPVFVRVAFSSLFQHVIITLFLDDTGITHIVFQLKASILVPYFSKWQHRRRMAHQIWNFAYR